MKKFVFINAAGEPKHICTPSDESVFEVGKLYDGLLCQEVPIEAVDTEIIQRWYWKNGIQKLRPIKPHEYVKWDPVTETWVEDLELLKEQIRMERNMRLQASDWTQLPDVQLETKAQWAAYRQQLRDVTNQTDLFNIVWPQPPQ